MLTVTGEKTQVKFSIQPSFVSIFVKIKNGKRLGSNMFAHMQIALKVMPI